MGTVWQNWKLKIMTDRIEKLESLLKLMGEVISEGQDESVIDGLKFINFKDDISGKGFIWSGSGHTKQFLFHAGPDRFFSSENIDLAKGKNFSVNGVKVIDDSELGTSIIKSNLRELGRLKGLVVDGSMSVNQYLYYDAITDRLGLGTEQPNAALSIADQGIELVLGAREYVRAGIGTFNSADLELLTDNTARISISAGGNIELGNRNNGPIQVSIHGTLGVNVGTPDSRTSLHVGGAIKFNDKLHLSGIEPPQGGAFNQGDIMWNSNPQPGRCIGWVCIQAGNPGMWNAFGEIK
jgi:hypothetical protein